MSNRTNEVEPTRNGSSFGPEQNSNKFKNNDDMFNILHKTAGPSMYTFRYVHRGALGNYPYWPYPRAVPGASHHRQ